MNETYASCDVMSHDVIKKPTPTHIFISMMIGKASDLHSARNGFKSGPRTRYSARAFIYTM
jgi:hypothetical protein